MKKGLWPFFTISLLLHCLLLLRLACLPEAIAFELQRNISVKISKSSSRANSVKKNRYPPQNSGISSHKQNSGGPTSQNKSLRFSKNVVEKLNADIENSLPYPERARLMGWQGKLSLKVTVAANGRVMLIETIKNSRYGDLDHAAINHIRNWQFSQGYVEETIILQINFSLK